VALVRVARGGARVRAVGQRRPDLAEGAAGKLPRLEGELSHLEGGLSH
jgi:hypothetical protein